MTSKLEHFEEDGKHLEGKTLKGWVDNDLTPSLSNAIEKEVVDPAKNFARDVEWLLSGGQSKPAAIEIKKLEPSDLTGQATDFAVHGTVGALVYSAAGCLTQAVGRRFGTAFKLGGTAMKLLDNRFTGQVVGAGIHDFYLNAQDMKGRVANAVGGATTMVVYDGANHLLPGKCRFTKVAAQPFIGAASAASGYYASSAVEGREIKQDDLLRAGGEGAAFGTVFLIATWGLGKFGSHFQPRRSGSLAESGAHSRGAENAPHAKGESTPPTAKTQIYKGQVLEGRIEKNLLAPIEGKVPKANESSFKFEGNQSFSAQLKNLKRGLRKSIGVEFEGKSEPKGIEAKNAEAKFEPKEAEAKKAEVKEVEVREAETKKTEVKEVEVREAETKKAEVKEVAVRDTETKKTEVKEVEVRETETKKTEVKEVEVREAETKKTEVKEVAVRDTETKKTEVKEVEVREAETKKTEVKEVEVREAETRKAEVKEVAVRDTETKKTEVKEVEVKETETKKAEVKEVAVRETETKQASIGSVEFEQPRDARLEEAVSAASKIGQVGTSASVANEPVTTQTANVASMSNAFTAGEVLQSVKPLGNPLSAEKVAAFESKFGSKLESKSDVKYQSKYGMLPSDLGVHGKLACYALPFSAAGGSIVAAHSVSQSTVNSEESISDQSSLQLSLQEVIQAEKFRKQLPDWMDELGFRVGLYSPPNQISEVLNSPTYQAARRTRFAQWDQATTKFTRIVAPSFSQALRAAEKGHPLRGPHSGMPGVLSGFDAVTLSQYEEVMAKVPELYGKSKSAFAGNAEFSREVMFRRYPFLTQDSRRQSALAYSAENSENASVGMLGSGGSANDPSFLDPSVLSATGSASTIPAAKQ